MKNVLRPLAVAALVAAVAGLCVVAVFDHQEGMQLSEAVQQIQQNQETQQCAAPVAIPSVPAKEVTLPNDGKAYFLSIVVDADWRARKRDRELLAWFRAERRLAALQGQTHYNLYLTNDPIFKANLSYVVGGSPAVVLQDSTGKVVYSSWDGAGKLPESGEALADQIAVTLEGTPERRRQMQEECDCRPRPNPVNTNPIVEVNINRDKPAKPVMTVEAKKDDAGFWILLGVAVALSALVTFIVQFKREAKAAG